jgi:hypothetical protein
MMQSAAKSRSTPCGVAAWLSVGRAAAWPPVASRAASASRLSPRFGMRVVTAREDGERERRLPRPRRARVPREFAWWNGACVAAREERSGNECSICTCWLSTAALARLIARLVSASGSIVLVSVAARRARVCSVSRRARAAAQFFLHCRAVAPAFVCSRLSLRCLRMCFHISVAAMAAPCAGNSGPDGTLALTLNVK